MKEEKQRKIKKCQEYCPQALGLGCCHTPGAPADPGPPGWTVVQLTAL